MVDQWWSWVLGFIGVVGFVLAGKKVWWAWYINLGNQILWFVYSIVSEQYGFLVVTVVYTAVFTKNAISWTREHFNGKKNHNHRLDKLWTLKAQERYDNLVGKPENKDLYQPQISEPKFKQPEQPFPRKKGHW